MQSGAMCGDSAKIFGDGDKNIVKCRKTLQNSSFSFEKGFVVSEK
jgi:hypothetical protein